jgi:hypothetical protein
VRDDVTSSVGCIAAEVEQSVSRSNNSRSRSRSRAIVPPLQLLLVTGGVQQTPKQRHKKNRDLRDPYRYRSHPSIKTIRVLKIRPKRGTCVRTEKDLVITRSELRPSRNFLSNHPPPPKGGYNACDELSG